ncbi:Sensor histidine kinase graS [Aedoeadaptatus ivorii]|uniref:histidine kinase n=1 Tax=Aedoeadaptatus ivorii TaxID=54006 RepID=A0A448V029_9FIRM|nr:sensor histidine kinase [Peptoniphilus ivorii]MDQ0508583.1 signal transduction histidine kinase [Peptoniphilus ivorii]VEJ34481.1 Sensor histidine kinase graS [Peptoniphilus ivorii]
MFRNFLYEEKRGLFAFLATALVVLAATRLYMPRAEFLYTAVILAAGFCLFGILRYLDYSGRREALAEILGAPPEKTAAKDVEKKIRALEAEREAVQEADEARARHTREYMTVWSHQLKSPLFALRLLIPDEDAEPEEMLAEVFRMENYVDSLLGYYRLESDSTDYVFRTESVAELVAESVRKYRAAAAAAGSEIVLNAGDLRIVTDRKWFCFMFEQVLSNAIKYAARGAIRIGCDGGVLTVADEGIGIAPEDLPRLFERGFTGKNGRIQDRSTGLGLYLVHRVAKELNILVSVRSEAGAGTAVDFDLSAVTEGEAGSI